MSFSVKLLLKKLERYMSRFNSDDRIKLYKNIEKMFRYNKPISEAFINLSNAMLVAKNQQKADSYADIATVFKNSTKSASPLTDALYPYIPADESEMLLKAEKSGRLVDVLPYVRRISEANKDIRAHASKLQKTLITYSVGYLILMFYMEPIVKVLLTGTPEKLTSSPIASLLIEASQFVQSAWVQIVLSLLAYVLFYFLYRNRSPSRLRSLADNLPLFGLYREMSANMTLITLALEMHLGAGENEAKIVRRVAGDSRRFVREHLYGMAGLLESGAAGYNDALAVCKLFSNKTRSTMAEIQAVSSDDAGLIEATIESAVVFSQRIGATSFKVGESFKQGLTVIMLLVMMLTSF